MGTKHSNINSLAPIISVFIINILSKRQTEEVEICCCRLFIFIYFCRHLKNILRCLHFNLMYDTSSGVMEQMKRKKEHMQLFH